MKKQSILISVFVTVLNAVVALLFTDTRSQWYSTLIKPAFQPPPAVFFIGWTVICILFCIAFSCLLHCNAGNKIISLCLLQAIANAMWCATFFYLHLPTLSLGVILLYLIFTFATENKAFKTNKTVFFLLLPQTCWLVFATALNYAIILLN